MRLIPLTLVLAVIGLSGPALAEGACNGTNDPCKVGDCSGGDMLVWRPNSPCRVSATPGGAGRLAGGALGGGAAGSGPAASGDQAVCQERPAAASCARAIRSDAEPAKVRTAS